MHAENSFLWSLNPLNPGRIHRPITYGGFKSGQTISPYIHSLLLNVVGKTILRVLGRENIYFIYGERP